MNRFVIALGVALAIGGCRAAIESGLPEGEANRALVALDRHGIHAVKEAEAAAGDEPTYTVLVAGEDVAAALEVLHAEDVPSRPEPGLHEVFGEGSLVPTATEERARLTAALGGELARTIEAIDGVLDARVHVALPDDGGRLLDDAPSRPRASVLVRWRGEHQPYDDAAIRQLVAGAIQGMEAADVAIVGVRAPEAAESTTHLTSIGPIAVARGSATALKATFGTLLGTNVVLAIALAMVFARRRRAAEKQDSAKEGGTP
jgi:type III secretion protein J